MSDVLVRLAGPDDYQAAGELREAAYAHDYDISDDYRESLRDAAPRDGIQVWVAVDRPTGRLLGTVVTPAPGGHMLLAVDPAARRRGIGRLLVEHVIALAAERGDARRDEQRRPDDRRAPALLLDALQPTARARDPDGSRPDPAAVCLRV